jgi:predicted transcriptional regulator
MVNSVKVKKMLSKLRQPLGIDYISKNILNVNESEARDILNELIEDGIIVKKNNEYQVKGNKKI